MKIVPGFEAAFAGVADRCGQEPLAVYSVTRCLEVIVAQMKDDGLELSEGQTLQDAAREHFEFNIRGAWWGDDTPMFIQDDTWAGFLERQEIDDPGRLEASERERTIAALVKEFQKTVSLGDLEPGETHADAAREYYEENVVPLLASGALGLKPLRSPKRE